MPIIQVKPLVDGVNVVNVSVDTATPFDTPAGAGVTSITDLTPGYVLDGKKHQQTGAQAEPAFKQLPIQIHQPLAGGQRVRVKLTEITATDPQDPKVGRRHYLIQFFDFTGGVQGNLLHQEEAFFDQELSTTTFSGSSILGAGAISGTTVFTPYSGFAPGDQFQKGSIQQPALVAKGFFIKDA